MRSYAMTMLFVYLMAGSLTAQDCSAAIFKYVDKDGTPCFADDLQSVPEPYRASSQIISGEASTICQNTPRQQQGKTASGTVDINQNGTTHEQQPFNKRVLISVLVVISAAFIFTVLRVIEEDHKKAVAIGRAIVLWGVSVYLVYAHAGDVLHGFASIGEKIENAKQQSEEQGGKAVKAIKEQNAFIEHIEHHDKPPSQ